MKPGRYLSERQWGTARGGLITRPKTLRFRHTRSWVGGAETGLCAMSWPGLYVDLGGWQFHVLVSR